MRKTAILAGGVLSLLLQAAPALADDCTPKLISALDMIDEPDGRIAVAVGLGGAQHRLLIATTSPHSELFQAAVTAAGFRQSNLPDSKSFDYFGGHAVGYATVEGLTLGSARGGTVQVLVTPGGYPPDPEVVGTLGADLLGNFDVELNFQTHRINLFASNPCDGKGVYWSSDAAQHLHMARGRADCADDAGRQGGPGRVGHAGGRLQHACSTPHGCCSGSIPPRRRCARSRRAATAASIATVSPACKPARSTSTIRASR